MLQDVVKRLHERDIEIEISQPAMDVLVKEGSDFAYGARPLKRAIQRLVEDPVSDIILKGEVEEGGLIKVEEKDGDLDFKVSDAGKKNEEVERVKED